MNASQLEEDHGTSDPNGWISGEETPDVHPQDKSKDSEVYTDLISDMSEEGTDLNRERRHSSGDMMPAWPWELLEDNCNRRTGAEMVEFDVEARPPSRKSWQSSDQK